MPTPLNNKNPLKTMKIMFAFEIFAIGTTFYV